MKFDELLALLRERFILILVVIVITAPTIFGLCRLIYADRLDTLQKSIDHLQLRLSQPIQGATPTTALPAPAPAPAAAPASKTNGAGSRYPAVGDPNHPTKENIRDLARFYDLFTKWRVNPDRRFQEGDISYFFEQNMTENDLKLAFEARRQVLQRAEETGERIPTSGDLSAKAEEIERQLRHR